MEMVSIPKKEYQKLKKLEKEVKRQEVEASIERSLRDAEEGRITRVA